MMSHPRNSKKSSKKKDMLLQELQARVSKFGKEKIDLTPKQQALKEVILTGLTRTERIVIILYYFEELTIPEIAKTLFLNRSVIEQYYRSAQQKMKAAVS